jgi:site-specific DNA-methyltransferase (adenine-specific)
VGKINLINADCMEYMATCDDNSFDLAIVDPPYFEGPQKNGYYTGTKQSAKTIEYMALPSWEVPGQEYIDELIRISTNQIIWGINYFDVSLPGGRIVWIKADQGTPFSQADIAYHSFYNRIDTFKCLWAGFWKDKKTKGEHRIHPTQKPIALYDWLLHNYAKPGQKIIDTHLGSGSSAIAAHYFGCDFVGLEIDKDYFEAAQKRFKNETRQIAMF